MNHHFTFLPELAFRSLGGRLLTLEGGLFGGSPPKAPDYKGAAIAQAESSREVTDVQNWANRPTQITPWGRTDWGAELGTDPASGKPITKWTQTESLTPEAQKALESQGRMQSGRSDIALDRMGQVSRDLGQEIDWDALPGRQNAPGQTTQTTNEAGFAGERNRIEGALFDRMRPEHDYQNTALDTKLANQGLTPGSAAYNRAKQQLGDQQGRERFNAMTMGGEEQSRMQQALLAQQGQAYGQGMQGAGFQNTNRQAAIAEEATRRGMTINEMNALIEGQQVQNPQMPDFKGASAAQPVNYLGAAQMKGQYAMDAYNAKQASSPWGDIGSMAGTAASLYGMSDLRLKSNIKRVGQHPIGVDIYEYDIDGHRERGVIAQELMQVAPELVVRHPNGYLMVNYGGLQ